MKKSTMLNNKLIKAQSVILSLFQDLKLCLVTRSRNKAVTSSAQVLG